MHPPAARKRRLPLVSAAVAALAVVAWVLAGSPSPSSSPPHPAHRSRETLASGAHPRFDRSRGTLASNEHPRFGQHAPAADPPAAAAAPGLVPSPTPRGTPVSIALGAHPRGAAIPAAFLGLSFEVRSLPLIASWAHRGDLVALLRSLGPGVMRFGGVSADEQTAWVPAGGAKPSWAIATVGEADIANLAALARASGWRVLLTVNLAHFERDAAAHEAAVAHALLGPYLAGIEIGNEPDLFPRKRLRPPGFGVSSYLPQAASYIAAVQAAAPGVPIAGPDPSTGVHGLTWVRDAAATLHPQLLTDHYYPLSSCGEHPTVSELLSPTVRLHESEMLANMLAIAHAHRTPLRMDESNSISCEGEPGVSNTFASALWALDWIARGMTAGTVGVNFHDLIEKPTSYAAIAAHSPRALAAGDLHAAPEWYALLAAHALAGKGGARPLPLTVSGAAAGELSAYGLRAPDGTVRLALIDYAPPGSPPLAISLRGPRSLGGGAILRLTGPSPAATAGARLGGRAVGADGTWAPASALPAVHGRPGALAVQLAPSSAAVVTLAPQRQRARAALPG